VAQHRDLRSEVHVGGDDHAEGQDTRHEDGGPLDVSARQVRAGVGRPDQQQDHQREGEREQRVLGAAPETALLE
jgi:hypothetical protein